MNFSLWILTISSAVVLCSNSVSAHTMQIASFNVQVFGQTKVAKPEVLDILAKIVIEYDIIFIQEIRDSSQTAIHTLLDKVNNISASKPYQYKMVVSDRLGRTSSKEQYAFLYVNTTVSIKASHLCLDPKDVYEREPFAVLVESTYLRNFTKMVLIGMHVKPDDVVSELNAMYNCTKEVQNLWGVSDLLLMGDFNADCSYLSQSKAQTLQLRQDQSFHWVISDDADSTVATTTNCSYDRFIVKGKNLMESIVPGSPKTVYFDQIYHLNETLTLAVSDHYPIELQLYAKHMSSAVSGSGISKFKKSYALVVFTLSFIKLVQNVCLAKL